jgi:hypothetical protein
MRTALNGGAWRGQTPLFQVGRLNCGVRQPCVLLTAQDVLFDTLLPLIKLLILNHSSPSHIASDVIYAQLLGLKVRRQHDGSTDQRRRFSAEYYLAGTILLAFIATSQYSCLGFYYSPHLYILYLWL